MHALLSQLCGGATTAHEPWILSNLISYILYLTMSSADFFTHSLEKTELQTLFPWLTTLLNMRVIYSGLISSFNELINNVKKQSSRKAEEKALSKRLVLLQ